MSRCLRPAGVVFDAIEALALVRRLRDGGLREPDWLGTMFEVEDSMAMRDFPARRSGLVNADPR
ncbi:hypothetical protein GGR61_003026 [Xanthomonas arboricola]|uniref:hypothetical protein n=1 Tax=Xanthomonas sp. 3075 TaxID=3035315 RepID=UPI001614B2F2|nr:hypothetical protein [Xanthomonas sp. 3075]MBB4131828.1 hypothetical protein [Xanthomonas sp. 3075]MBB5865375.1 hypothetical protein [Xanthomonas sp. 3058]